MVDPATQSADREVEAVEIERLRSARNKTLQSLARLKDRVEEDVLVVPHEKPFGGEVFKTKSTVPSHPALLPLTWSVLCPKHIRSISHVGEVPATRAKLSFYEPVIRNLSLT